MNLTTNLSSKVLPDFQSSSEEFDFKGLQSSKMISALAVRLRFCNAKEGFSETTNCSHLKGKDLSEFRQVQFASSVYKLSLPTWSNREPKSGLRR